MRLRFIVILILTGFIFKASAQADADAVKLADEMYGFGDKRDALDVYLQAISINPNNARANYMAGKCYQETIEKSKSVSYLEKSYSLDKKSHEDILYLIGKGYQYGNEFDKAIEYFELYKKTIGQSKLVNSAELIAKSDKHIEECNNGKILLAQKASKELVNVGAVINSEYEEYAPVISSDELTMFFTSRRQGSTGNKKDVDNEFFEDIYFSTRTKDGSWTTPKNLGSPVNSEFHESCNAISPDGKQLFIYTEAKGGGIFVSKKMPDGNWSAPEKVKGHINSKYGESSMCFSGDGKKILFASDRPGGKGKLDLYSIKLDGNDKWGEPENLGNEINTEYNEDSPFLDSSGTTLFFSSAGHNTMGGYDIFKSKFENGKWSKPENLGYPINTTDDDIYYTESGDGLHGYYSSVRTDGNGAKDIYMITNAKPAEEPIVEKPVASNVEEKKDTASVAVAEEVKPVEQATEEKPEEAVVPVANQKPSLMPVTVKGRVYDAESGAPIEASVKLLDEKGNLVQTITTSADGYYSTVLNEKKNRAFSMVVQPSGFLKKSVKLAVKPGFTDTETVQDLALSKYVAGQKYILRNIYFDFNQATLKPESGKELGKLIQMLQNHPETKIEIAGHTDFVGSLQYNKTLSQKRAQAVVDYLIKKGISPDRLTAVGFGKEHPLASNDDEEEGRELNRRTEFKIL
jgi:outer membrane protein OmpA-like peptidoglycan-associated protein/ribulose bisphosphate carboxylase small subunit